MVSKSNYKKKQKKTVNKLNIQSKNKDLKKSGHSLPINMQVNCYESDSIERYSLESILFVFWQN